jgi:hypothetical protein
MDRWFASLPRPTALYWVPKVRSEAAMHAGSLVRAGDSCTESTRDGHRYSLPSSTPKRFPSFGYEVR